MMTKMVRHTRESHYAVPNNKRWKETQTEKERKGGNCRVLDEALLLVLRSREWLCEHVDGPEKKGLDRRVPMVVHFHNATVFEKHPTRKCQEPVCWVNEGARHIHDPNRFVVKVSPEEMDLLTLKQIKL